MKKMGIVQAVKSLLFQDVKSENETKKAAVILRLFAVIMWVYYLVLLSVFLVHGDVLIFEASIPCGLFYLVAFYETYRDRTKLSIGLVNVVTLAWILAIVFTIGWDSGVQHFLFVLMMLVFMTAHGKMEWKIFYAIFLCALRIGLYLYTLGHKPDFVMHQNIAIAFQFLNTIAISGIIIVSLYIYSKDSMEMENKLMVYNDKLKRMASIDPLTSLGNRRNILGYLEKKASEYTDGKISNLSVALGDIDFFKKINDRYGHECGDIVLKQLSVLMQRKLEGKAQVGRWGGEEFLFVFPECNGDEATALLSELLNDIRRMEIVYGQERVSLTMTLGVAEYDFRSGADETIKDADHKLYIGKESGRNRVVF